MLRDRKYSNVSVILNYKGVEQPFLLEDKEGVTLDQMQEDCQSSMIETILYRPEEKFSFSNGFPLCLHFLVWGCLLTL